MNTQLIIQICVVAVVVASFIGWLVWQIKKKGLKEFAIDMILQAEEEFEKGQNREKMESVIVAIKTMLGTNTVGRIISIFITDENIEKFIQGVFDGLKKALDYTPNK